MANGQFGGGDGTAASPFIVQDALDLRAMENGMDKHYKQDRNIALTGSFNPIGSRSSTTRLKFTGVYDGAAFLISGLTQNRSDYFSGLFVEISWGGTVKNTHLVNASITTTQAYSGTLAASVAGGTVQSCSASGIIKGLREVGGLVGNLTGGKVENSFSSCTVMGTDTDVGGLIGLSNADVLNCYASGEVHGKGETGGLIGQQIGGEVRNCYASGRVFTKGPYTGGLIGKCDSFGIHGCYALNPSITRTEGTASTVGPFAGYAQNEPELLAQGNYYLDTMEYIDTVVNT